MRLSRFSSGCLLAMIAGGVGISSLTAAEEKVQIEENAITAEAFLGEPFGVCRLKVKATSGRFFVLPDRPLCELKEKNQRALYPVFPLSDSEKEYWSQADRAHKAGTVEALFLFKGEKPLELSWRLPNGKLIEKTITPKRVSADRRKEMLSEWWKRYTYTVRRRSELDAYPPQVENYLVSMLAERLNYEPPRISNPWSGRKDLDHAFGLLLGAESIRVAMQRDTVLKNTNRGEPLNQALPKAVAPPAIELPKFDKSKVTPEAIASHVPAECFYIRCGNFQNFQWMRSNLTHWGAMARDLTAVRGWNFGIREQLEYQLALKETILSKLFGETLISDVAIIGQDTFVRAGASIGIVFEARNSTLLKIQLDKLRREAKAADSAATETTVNIAGHKVSFLSTPDNKIRAFYAVDGDYHLISTSRTLVERFYEAGQKKDSLAGLDEFLYARHLMPTSREDSAFVYLSDSFFRHFVGPKYRAEMTRRTQAVAEIELVHLAVQAAKAEGAKHETIHQLVDGNFLPGDFHSRPDGSHTVMENGKIFDSKRGARGTFLPVADVDVDELTESEFKAYQQFALFYRSQWERMDPAILAIKRRPAAKSRERISVDVHITPYARMHYQSLTRSLGEPNSWQLIPNKEDLAQATVNFPKKGGFLSNQFGYAGIRDLAKTAIEFKIENGQVLETVTPPIYYGLLVHSQLDLDSKENQGKTEKSLAEESMFFYPYDVPDQPEIRKNLKLKKADAPAQLRVWVNRLAETNIANIINAHAYMRSRRASAGNAQLLHVLTEQLNVEPAQALSVAKKVLGAEPVCRMGGQYQLKTDDRGFTAWQSSAWKQGSYHAIQEVPTSFASPLIKGFHEGELHFTIDRTTLSSHLELEIDSPKSR